MFKKILIPLDESTLAERALHYLPAIADKEQSQILLVSIIEPQMYSFSLASKDAALIAQLKRDIEQGLQKYLHRIQDRLTEQGYNVTIHQLYGDAAQSIADVATKEACDLIAMTTHGRTGISRWMFGSVADRVLHVASQPILLANASLEQKEPLSISHVLVPLDGSELAEQVLKVAQSVALLTGAEVKLLHVLAHLGSTERQLMAQNQMSTESFQENRTANARSYLERVREQLHQAQVASSYEIVSGQAATAILDRTATDEIDLLIMSTHGRSGYSRWAFGSVVSKVLYRAGCPLILMRGLATVKLDEAEKEGSLEI